MLLALQLCESVCCCRDFVRLGTVTKQMLYSVYMQQVASCMCLQVCPCIAFLWACSHAYAWQSEGNAQPDSAFH